MKLEKRVLVVVRAFGFVVTVLLRGIRGIEAVTLFDSCEDLLKFLASRRGVAGEINCVATIEDACRDEIESLGLDIVEPESLPRVLRDEVRKATSLAISVGAHTFVRMIEVLRADR